MQFLLQPENGTPSAVELLFESQSHFGDNLLAISPQNGSAVRQIVQTETGTPKPGDCSLALAYIFAVKTENGIPAPWDCLLD